jgi:hypothetical protein
MLILHDINFGAVCLAAIAKVVIGSFWYSPLIFGKAWMRENKLSEADFIKGHPIWVMALLSLSFAFAGALAMAFFMTPQSTALSGAGLGFVVSSIWISASKANTTLYENYSIRHYLIHAGYDVLGYTTMGAILGAWN